MRRLESEVKRLQEELMSAPKSHQYDRCIGLLILLCGNLGKA